MLRSLCALRPGSANTMPRHGLVVIVLLLVLVLIIFLPMYKEHMT